MQSSITELVNLQEVRSQNDRKEWKSKMSDLEKCKELTQRFCKHLVNLKLDGSSNPNAIKIQESKFLPPNSVVLSGKEVFTIFFEGTTFCDTAKNGDVIECDLKNDWDVVALAFENAL